MSHYREGHWRTNSAGNTFWVNGHSVDRWDWAGGGLTYERPAENLGDWGRHECRRLESFTIPNARCPVCGELVFFYQSKDGGKVFFDPPLGPPWPKHPCTDTSSTFISTEESSSLIRGLSDQLLKHPISSEEASLYGQAALEKMEETGWFPIVDLKISQVGNAFHIRGRTQTNSNFMALQINSALYDFAPTFSRIDNPQRIICNLEQVRFNKHGNLKILKQKAWFQAESKSEARNSKSAERGAEEAMLRLARDRLFRFLGADNLISDVSNFVDVEAALYWYGKAIAKGSFEARLELAYIFDLQRWNPSNQERPDHKRMRTISNRIGRLQKAYGEKWIRLNGSKDWLYSLLNNPHTPKLNQAIWQICQMTD